MPTSGGDITIRVCQGPDCTGLGGGAAILEIEELVLEYQYNRSASSSSSLRQEQRIPSCRVLAGACRDLCTVGPNVHVQHTAGGGFETSFAAVNAPAKCASVVEAAFSAVAAAATVSNEDDNIDDNVDNMKGGASLSVVQSSSSSSQPPPPFYVRRLHRTRWDALRQVARLLAKARKTASTRNENSSAVAVSVVHVVERIQTACRQVVAQGLQQEVAVIHTDMRDRAQRRWGRLEQGAVRAVGAAFADDSESDDEDDTDEDNTK